jgi:thiamine transporter ThiT
MTTGPGREKRIAKIVFWCLAPVFFAGFLRFYAAIFHLVCGTVLVGLFGDKAIGAAVTVSLVLSIGCSGATCYLLWKYYRTYILGGG